MAEELMNLILIQLSSRCKHSRLAISMSSIAFDTDNWICHKRMFVCCSCFLCVFVSCRLLMHALAARMDGWMIGCGVKHKTRTQHISANSIRWRKLQRHTTEWLISRWNIIVTVLVIILYWFEAICRTSISSCYRLCMLLELLNVSVGVSVKCKPTGWILCSTNARVFHNYRTGWIECTVAYTDDLAWHGLNFLNIRRTALCVWTMM